MSYKITFDNKAKEIIKTVVNNGDTPTPTPTGGARLIDVSGKVLMLNLAKLKSLLVKKNIDIDAELDSWYSGIIFAVGQSYPDYAEAESVESLASNLSISLEGRGSTDVNFYFGFGWSNHVECASSISESDPLTIKALLDNCSNEIAISTSNAKQLVFPMLGVRTGSAGDIAYYEITEEEFLSFITIADKSEEE